MPFDINSLESLLPPELSAQKKDRLKESLKQFLKENQNKAKYYTDFYSNENYPYFLQGDVIREIRFPVFNFGTGEYEKEYFDVILISNTCDMDEANTRKVKKNVIIAKLIPFDNFIEALKELRVEKADDIIIQVQNQLYSNLFYLPPNYHGVEYIVYLDELSWITISELKDLKEDMQENRIASLDFYGYYLFVLKLSYHLCLLPEETHR